jgi:Ankyrin repeats (3 copies)
MSNRVGQGSGSSGRILTDQARKESLKKSSLKDSRQSELHQQQEIVVEAVEEDLELISRSYKQSKRTMVEQNPHFKRSIIQSILKNNHYGEGSLALPGTGTLMTIHRSNVEVHASNDQDRGTAVATNQQPQLIQGIQTIIDQSASGQLHNSSTGLLESGSHTPIQPAARFVQFSDELEMKAAQMAVEENNLAQLVGMNYSRVELASLRFKHSLNILQAASYFGAEKILKYLRDLLKDEEQIKKDLAEYQEPNGGNMAIHFAVLKGNKRIIDILIQDFKADPTALTYNGLCVLHCAAQFERGVLSMEYFFQEIYDFDVDYRDKFQCTPLHFAILNMQVKCVECLLALKADPNAKNSDSQTPLHIAVQRYIQQSLDAQDESEFEDVKRVIKELLFNGADRSLEGRFNLSLLDEEMPSAFIHLTPKELLEQFEHKLPPKEYLSLSRILVNYHSNMFLELLTSMSVLPD